MPVYVVHPDLGIDNILLKIWDSRIKRIWFWNKAWGTCCSFFGVKKYRSSRPEVFCKKGVLGNFAKFTRKHLRQSLSFNKVTGWGLQLYWERDWHSCFPVNIAKFLKTHFVTEHLQYVLLEIIAFESSVQDPSDLSTYTWRCCWCTWQGMGWSLLWLGKQFTREDWEAWGFELPEPIFNIGSLNASFFIWILMIKFDRFFTRIKITHLFWNIYIMSLFLFPHLKSPLHCVFNSIAGSVCLVGCGSCCWLFWSCKALLFSIHLPLESFAFSIHQNELFSC